jgi:flagellar basal body-associated protein FliL
MAQTGFNRPAKFGLPCSSGQRVLESGRMSANDLAPKIPSSARLRVRRFRIIGLVVLVLGLAGAGAVYWLGSRESDNSDDPSMLGFNRGEERQMEILYGKQGELIEEFTNDLKQPGTQAGLIIAATVIVAGGCFYFARLLADEAKSADVNGPQET